MLELRYDPDPILAEVCKPVEVVTPEIQDLAAQMQVKMIFEGGAGLAAPQVGHAIRMFVTYDPLGDEKSKPLVFINPVFTFKSPKLEKNPEGCLSFPERPKDMSRHVEVAVKALDVDGKEFVVRATGFFARCLQHENDHLDGKTLYPVT